MRGKEGGRERERERGRGREREREREKEREKERRRENERNPKYKGGREPLIRKERDEIDLSTGEIGRIATLLFVVKLYSTTLKAILPQPNQMEPLTSKMSRKSAPPQFLIHILHYSIPIPLQWYH